MRNLVFAVMSNPKFNINEFDFNDLNNRQIIAQIHRNIKNIANLICLLNILHQFTQ